MYYIPFNVLKIILYACPVRLLPFLTRVNLRLITLINHKANNISYDKLDNILAAFCATGDEDYIRFAKSFMEKRTHEMWKKMICREINDRGPYLNGWGWYRVFEYACENNDTDSVLKIMPLMHEIDLVEMGIPIAYKNGNRHLWCEFLNVLHLNDEWVDDICEFEYCPEISDDTRLYDDAARIFGNDFDQHLEDIKRTAKKYERTNTLKWIENYESGEYLRTIDNIKLYHGINKQNWNHSTPIRD